MINTEFSNGCERVGQRYNETHDVNYQSLAPVSLNPSLNFELFILKKKKKK